MQRMVNLSRNGLSGDAKYGDQKACETKCPTTSESPDCDRIMRLHFGKPRYALIGTQFGIRQPDGRQLFAHLPRQSNHAE